MNILRYVGYSAGLLLTLLASYIWYQSGRTESDILAFRERVIAIASDTPAPQINTLQVARLPAPVQRYFDYTFRGPVDPYSVVSLEAEGDFRRPLMEHFEPTTAEQVIAIGTPALMFSATTPIFPGVWARPYDFFAEGEMEMKAKIMSTITVVDEQGSDELNRISLRRWLLESPLYPQALLPGGPVVWEAVDDMTARAVIRADGLTADMLFHFNSEGQITFLSTEQDGDLNTPYHGSGEHVTRADYRQIDNMMIPHSFTISRAAKGEVYPFFDAKITSIVFE
ncbi:hypothetical protein SAMN05444358_1162 [Ruegeria halocynthiae]|uniref:Uncharacterized protein n=1 Tax=Ruegeria halocynthiae TaxID=985054 RepID=A0A1H3FKB6_9RHOB|nr:DUF6544 family protein [Ruegeria halocynthiae]SDX91446.1 hypothetical protein SAMN05444358_1162 [Ruegeria halocynthiae]